MRGGARHNTFHPSNGEKTDQHWKDLGNILNAEGKLMEAEKEWWRSKGLCFYCGEAPEKCWHNAKPPTASGRATFTISGEPPTEATIKEVPGDATTPSGN